LSVILHLGYLSYYLILAAAPLGPWLRGDVRAARETVLSMMVAFYVCYAVFLSFPVAGPRYVFPRADNAATAVLPAQLTQRLLDSGAAWGTAFPSSHVAVALVAAVCALRFRRGLGAVLLPLAIALTLGTVYGQFHYALDALAGALLAGVVLALSRPARPR
jgi:membrane-associated phospholipid phosphatase